LRKSGHQLLRCEPKRHIDVRSFPFGMALAPIAPHTVQTMRGPKDGFLFLTRKKNAVENKKNSQR
jgi:hypothetical protein